MPPAGFGYELNALKFAAAEVGAGPQLAAGSERGLGKVDLDIIQVSGGASTRARPRWKGANLSPGGRPRHGSVIEQLLQACGTFC